jgi:hypothetical protein
MSRSSLTSASVGFAVAFVLIWHAAAEPPPTRAAAPTWELLRSVVNPYGGTIDLVVIPEGKNRDLTNYRAAAGAVCGTRTECVVHFWTDRRRVPTSADMPVTDLQVMTAQYERARSYKTPHLRLACWLYPSKTAGETESCFYMPGASMPWERHP